MIASLTESQIAEALSRSLRHDDPFYEIPPDLIGRELVPAAVLMPLAKIEDEWHLLYTRRTDKVEHHKSQVSFPGGRCDPEDRSAEDTALREADEEIGLARSDVRVLGRLRELITITGYKVTPIVGVIAWPRTFRVHMIEVSRVFTMPLQWLADRRNRLEFNPLGSNRTVIAYFPHDGELLWGATARMTVDFIHAITEQVTK
jgi:8-oxo-dGTP pyrophosphatase MutT (NUDIX family)